MSKSPVVLQTTFAGLSKSQIQSEWVNQGGGLEAYVFDGSDLSSDAQWKTLSDNLRYAQDVGAHKLTMHFPTENADWVGDQNAFNKLLKFCDLAADKDAAGVVLHSNQFVQQSDWINFNLIDCRRRVFDRLAELDAKLEGWPHWVGIENMPIIGTEGNDYDSIFVFPQDFTGITELASPRIGVTWDICHWAVTWSTVVSIAQLQRTSVVHHPLDLPIGLIRHIHFGSFSGMAMPFSQNQCIEGVVPPLGDMNVNLLSSMLKNTVQASAPDVGVVLEIQESDYVNRKNCWETKNWIFACPELSALHTMNEVLP